MSALVELTDRLDALADRLDMTTGPGLAALQRHYIDPTVHELNTVASAAFGSNRQPFKGKPVPVKVDYTIDAGGRTVVFKLSPKGFWVFGQYGAKPHLIAVKDKQRLHAAGAAHPVRGPVNHPGSKGKRAIDGAWRAIHHNRHERITAAVDEVFTSG